MNRVEDGRRRKVRSDKKRDVKPTVSIELKDAIYRLSYIMEVPVKDVIERVCIDGLASRSIMEILAQSFRRDIRFENTVFMGDLSRPSLNVRKAVGATGRVSVRFASEDYENIRMLSYALDCTVSRACALLLETALSHSDFITPFCRDHIRNKLSPHRIEELRKVIRYLNDNSSSDDKISWALILEYARDGLDAFLDRFKA